MSDRIDRFEQFRQQLNKFADSGDQDARDKVQMANDYIDAYEQTSKFKAEEKDDRMLDIAGSKQEYTDLLDKMWANYMSGCLEQIVNYNEQVSYIKENGYKVLRNPQGKHKIVLRRD